MNKKSIFYALRKDMDAQTPDVWEKIQYANISELPKKAAYKPRRTLAFVSTFAVIAVIALSVSYGLNFFGNQRVLPPDLSSSSQNQNNNGIGTNNGSQVADNKKDENNNTQACATSATNTPGSDNKKDENNNTQTQQPYFNANLTANSKINALVKESSQEQFAQFFNVNSFGYDCQTFSLLYDQADKEIPWGAVVGYSEENRSFIMTLTGRDVRDFGLDNFTSTKCNSIDVYFGIVSEHELNATFKKGNEYYSIETTGFNQTELFEMVNALTA
jgi:hypothetical protein